MPHGFQSRLGIDTTPPVTRGFEFARCDVARHVTIVDTSGLRGTRAHLAERTRRGTSLVRGQIALWPSAAELARLLPWVCGGPVGNAYPLAEVPAERVVTVDKVAGVFHYAGCRVARAVLRGTSGEPVQLALDVLGISETRLDAFPSVAYDDGPPFMFADSALVLGDVEREVWAWWVEIDHGLEPIFANSETPLRIVSQDRVVRFGCRLPFETNALPLTDPPLAGSPALLTVARGAARLAMHFSAVQFPAGSPVVDGRREIGLEWTGVARRTSGSAEMNVTLDLA